MEENKAGVCGVYTNSSKSEMTLNYRGIMERYPFLNGAIGGSIPMVKSSLSLMMIKNFKKKEKKKLSR